MTSDFSLGLIVRKLPTRVHNADIVQKCLASNLVLPVAWKLIISVFDGSQPLCQNIRPIFVQGK